MSLATLRSGGTPGIDSPAGESLPGAAKEVARSSLRPLELRTPPGRDATGELGVSPLAESFAKRARDEAGDEVARYASLRRQRPGSTLPPGSPSVPPGLPSGRVFPGPPGRSLVPRSARWSSGLRPGETPAGNGRLSLGGVLR